MQRVAVFLVPNEVRGSNRYLLIDFPFDLQSVDPAAVGNVRPGSPGCETDCDRSTRAAPKTLMKGVN